MDSGSIDAKALVYHELRAPLGLVATAARSMADDMDDEELRSRAEVIVRAAERMLRTAETVAALGPWQGVKDNQTFPPAAIVKDLAGILAGLGVPLDVAVEVSGDTRLCGSAERFEALVHSVISNALDHGHPEEPIRVRVARVDGCVVVEVRNAMASEDSHRGRGLGTIIAGALARGLGARVDSLIEDGWHTARISFPRRRPRPAGVQSGGESTQSA